MYRCASAMLAFSLVLQLAGVSDATPSTFTVSDIRELESVLKAAVPGTTILINDGIYKLGGRMFTLAVPSVTIRSASGNREKVVLDGIYKSPSVFEISASGVTIADLTIKSPYNHAIHVFTSRSGGDIRNVHIRNVHIIDPGQQGIKINPAAEGASLINGTIEHSLIELTDAGRKRIRNNCYTGGIDAHHAKGWIVRDNEIRGFWCPTGLSEHAVHFWKGSQNTVVERNLLRDNARGIGFGMQAQKIKSENAACAAESDHIEGVIRDNFISMIDANLFSSSSGADCGICLWYACNARVAGNSIYSEQPSRTFSSIEWRFPSTKVEVSNNITNIRMLQRDGASAVTTGNRIDARPKEFTLRLADISLPVPEGINAR